MTTPVARAHPPTSRSPHSVRDVTDVQEAVRDAAASRRALRIAAGGSWLQAGRPVPEATPLDLAALRGIVEYIPGDLTLTARAATPLAEIDAATRANGQWLPLDGFGDSRSTLGATIATASAGPLAATIALPRDVTLGVEFVSGDGAIVRGGGRVVKNVAGFDLVRLTVGAWGTLGIVTEVTVRLRALPEEDATIALPIDGRPDGDRLGALLARLRGAPLTPLASELVSTSLAAQLGIGDSTTLLVRIAGNVEAVAAQRSTLRALGDAVEIPTTIWDRLRGIEPSEATTLRISGRPSAMAPTWIRLLAATSVVEGACLHASVERGIARAILTSATDAVAGTVISSLRAGGPMIGERLPASCWSIVPSPFDTALGRAARRAFDPAGILNPGLLGVA